LRIATERLRAVTARHYRIGVKQKRPGKTGAFEIEMRSEAQDPFGFSSV
jgi:hypothetical protein